MIISLLSQVGSATYSTTKHATVGFAEWLSITYGEKNIGVSLLCPQGVNTPMTEKIKDGGVAGINGMLEASNIPFIPATPPSLIFSVIGVFTP